MGATSSTEFQDLAVKVSPPPANLKSILLPEGIKAGKKRGKRVKFRDSATSRRPKKKSRNATMAPKRQGKLMVGRQRPGQKDINGWFTAFRTSRPRVKLLYEGKWGKIYAVKGAPSYLVKILQNEDEYASNRLGLLQMTLTRDEELARYFTLFTTVSKVNIEGKYVNGYAMGLINEHAFSLEERQIWACGILNFWELQKNLYNHGLNQRVLLIPDFSLSNLMWSEDENHLKIIGMENIGVLECKTMPVPSAATNYFVGNKTNSNDWALKNPGVCLYQTWASICFAVCSLWKTDEEYGSQQQGLESLREASTDSWPRFKGCLTEMQEGWDTRYLELRNAVKKLGEGLIKNQVLEEGLL